MQEDLQVKTSLGYIVRPYLKKKKKKLSFPKRKNPPPKLSACSEHPDLQIIFKVGSELQPFSPSHSPSFEAFVRHSPNLLALG
jgi:hypothetical protein